MMTAQELAAVRTIGNELHKIRTLLQQLLEVVMSPPEEPPPGCPHPEEDRVSLGMTNGQEEWECRQCQYRHPPAP